MTTPAHGISRIRPTLLAASTCPSIRDTYGRSRRAGGLDDDSQQPNADSCRTIVTGIESISVRLGQARAWTPFPSAAAATSDTLARSRTALPAATRSPFTQL